MERPELPETLFADDDGEPQPESSSPDASVTNTSLRRIGIPFLRFALLACRSESGVSRLGRQLGWKHLAAWFESNAFGNPNQ